MTSPSAALRIYGCSSYVVGTEGDLTLDTVNPDGRQRLRLTLDYRAGRRVSGVVTMVLDESDVEALAAWCEQVRAIAIAHSAGDTGA